MITCRAYSLSNHTCVQITHTTFSVLWNHIVRAVNRSIPPTDSSVVLKGRSTLGYNAAMGVEQYSDSDALCNTSKSDLSKRQHHLDRLQSSVCVGAIDQLYSRVFHTCYYRSTTQCIYDILGLKLKYCSTALPTSEVDDMRV